VLDGGHVALRILALLLVWPVGLFAQDLGRERLADEASLPFGS